MSKEAIRHRIWDRLVAEGVAVFPFPVAGRIPNFKGAQEAAERLANLDAWRTARVLKANPDSPQKWVRQRALLEGKIVYMAVPRLRQGECFLELNPGRLLRPVEAATIKGAFAHGRPRRPDQVKRIDLVVAGSVAVDGAGGRVGKGGGYSDLEYGLGRAFGFLEEDTPVVTTVHPLQVIQEEIPMLAHDVPLDYVATPEGVQATPVPRPKPRGIDWDLLPPEKIEAIPSLVEIRPAPTIREGRE